MNEINLREKEVFIFDFDKTICTLEADWDIWREERKNIVKKYDLEFSDDYLNHATQNDRFEKYGQEFKKEAGDQARSFEMSVPVCTPIGPTIELIKSLENKILYVWSSNSRDVVEKHLEEFGILDKFERIIAFGDVELLKPNSDGFKYIKKDIPNIDLSKVLFVGDSSADELAAKVVGIDYIDVVNLS